MKGTIKHAGKMYQLADLAHYMEDDQREMLHTYWTGEPEDCQGWWDEFCRRFPDEADHLARIAPPMIDVC